MTISGTPTPSPSVTGAGTNGTNGSGTGKTDGNSGNETGGNTGDSNGITKNNMYRRKIPRMQQSAELVKSKFGARSFFIRQNKT